MISDVAVVKLKSDGPKCQAGQLPVSLVAIVWYGILAAVSCRRDIGKTAYVDVTTSRTRLRRPASGMTEKATEGMLSSSDRMFSRGLEI